jgi:hypothetical protein
MFQAQHTPSISSTGREQHDENNRRHQISWSGMKLGLHSCHHARGGGRPRSRVTLLQKTMTSVTDLSVERNPEEQNHANR